MSFKTSHFFFSLCTGLSLFSSTPKIDNPLDKILAALQQWTTEQPIEKVYLHTDKPYYLVGDTIWFKAYITTGNKHQLSALSGALYVDLIRERDSLTQSIKLPVTAGMTKGEFVLSDSLVREGNYRIRAYTQWMRNAGPDYFYDKTFSVGSSIFNPLPNNTGVPHADEKLLTKNLQVRIADTQTDVQFFPEGGNLVNGIRSRVAFKATGVNGRGVPISGTITDSKDKEVATLTTRHLGLGSFMLTPENGEKYKAKVTYPDGSKNTISLPIVNVQGYVLSVYNNTATDTVLVRISTPPTLQRDGGQPLTLIAQSGGTVYYSLEIPSGKAVSSILIPAKDFATGIVQFTLFSEAGTPISERIIFIQNDDQMKLKLVSTKNVYSRREKISIDLLAMDHNKNPLTGSFSAAVTNEDITPIDENKEQTIFSQLLLSADIKGYIEQPNYYFNDPNNETKANLDLLMLTQGYRRFLWKSLLEERPYAAVYPAEKLASEFKGKLLTLGDKPALGGKVTIINNKTGFIMDALADEKGYFKFNNLIFEDGIDFSVIGKNAKNKGRVQVLMEEIPDQQLTSNRNIGDINTDIRTAISNVAEYNKRQELIAKNRSQIIQNQQLKEVKISKSKSNNFAAVVKPGEADQTITFDTRNPGKTLLDCLRQTASNNITFKSEMDPNCGMIVIPYAKDGRKIRFVVVIDGWKLRPENDGYCDLQDIWQLNPAKVVKVEVVVNNAKVRGLFDRGETIKSSPPPILVITTKSGTYQKNKYAYNPAAAYFQPQGYKNAKEFYAPKYNHPKQDAEAADLRTTVYWNPSVVVKDGKAEVSFYNGDVKGNYRILIEGIDFNGLIGRKIYHYKVE